MTERLPSWTRIGLAGLAAAGLTACQNLTAPVLVAGSSPAADQKPLASVGNIQDLAIDADENIYVVEGGSEPESAMTLRRIAPDGRSTVLGSSRAAEPITDGPLGQSNLVGLQGLAIQGNQLYLTGLNCLRKVDLKAAGELRVQSYWGSCQTASAYRAALNSGTKPTLFNSHLLVTADQTVYADVADQADKHIFKLASGQTEPEKISYAYEVLGMSIDSQGSLFLSHPWPAADGPGYIEKWAPPQVPLRIYPGAGQIITDTQDNLYFLDGNTLARYSPTNHRTEIGKVSGSSLDRSVARLAFNPGQSNLYVAAGESIYRFALPQN